MSINNAVLDNYERQTEGLDLLGRIVWWSVRDLSISWDLLGERAARVGLEEYMPHKPADSNVFRRVCSAAQTRLDPDVDGTYINVMIRNVSNQLDEVVRRIVCEKVDAEGKKLDYTETWDLIYSKEWGKCTSHPIDTSIEEANTIAHNVIAQFHRLRGSGRHPPARVCCHWADHVRARLDRPLADPPAPHPRHHPQKLSPPANGAANTHPIILSGRKSQR